MKKEERKALNAVESNWIDEGRHGCFDLQFIGVISTEVPDSYKKNSLENYGFLLKTRASAEVDKLVDAFIRHVETAVEDMKDD